MVVKAGDMRKSEFMHVKSDHLAGGNDASVTKVNYRAGDFIPDHFHPHEQSGFVLSGIYILRSEDIDEILVKGDSFSIPANVEHSLEVLETGEVIELNSPQP
jgi:quercetin dioxygenase-like cupin family protein